MLKDLWEIENGDIRTEIAKRGISSDYAEAVTKFYERFVSIKQVQVPQQLHTYADSAKVAVNSLERATRAGVSAYTTQLWCWQRLDYDRKKVSEKLALEHGGITFGLPNVDHCVSYAFWEEFVGKFASSPKGSDVYNRLLAKINQIGNCNVLCKEINCSKGSKTLREFFEKIGFDKSDASPLAIPTEMISPDADALTPELILEKIEERTSLIRSDLCLFLDGSPTHRLAI